MTALPPGYWSSTSLKQEVSGDLDRIPPYDPRSGEHHWVLLLAYRVNPAAWSVDNPPHLDMETLVRVSGPGCYYCEQEYTENLAHRRCPGEPK